MASFNLWLRYEMETPSEQLFMSHWDFFALFYVKKRVFA
jgi:hypothetical protein